MGDAVLLASTWFDLGLIAFHGAVLLAIALYAAGERRRAAGTSDGNEASSGAGRRAGAGPIPWYVVAATFPALTLPWMTIGDLSAGGYEAGWRLGLALAPAALAFLAVALVMPPLLQRLGGLTSLDYLELRFGAATRRLAAAFYSAGRLLLAAALLAWAARQASDGLGAPLPAWLLVVLLGAFATAAGALAGRRGLVWFDLWQSTLVCAALLATLVLLFSEPGVDRASISDTARRLGRSAGLASAPSGAPTWSLLLAALGYPLLACGWLGGDIAGQQRWLAAGGTGTSQRALLVGGAALLGVAWTSVYVGLGLLDVYHRRPELLRGKWVANVDSRTRESMTDPATRRRFLTDARTGEALPSLLSDTPQLDPTDGQPLLDWYADEVNAETLERLVAEGRLLRPNNQATFAESRELLDPETGRFDVARLAMRRPTEGREVILHRRAPFELLSWYVARRAPWGLRGVIWSGLIAGALSLVASSVAAASRVTGAAGASTVDDAWRPHSLRVEVAAGGVIVAAALALLYRDFAHELLIPGAAFAFTPLAAAILLGVTLRRGNGPTTALAMTVTWATLALLTAASLLGITRQLPPLAFVPIALVAGVVCGGVVALIATRPRARLELRGLTLGCGPLGVRQEHSAFTNAQAFATTAPPVPPAPPPTRWRD